MAAGLALSAIAGFALAAVLSPASLIESLTSDGAVPTFRFMWFMPIFCASTTCAGDRLFLFLLQDELWYANHIFRLV